MQRSIRNTITRTAAVALVTIGFAQAAAVSTACAAAVPVSPGIRMTRIQYDSRGPDDHTNISINREFVVLRNVGPAPVDVKGYTLRDRSGHVFTFATTFTLAAGAGVAVFSGKGNNTQTYRHWGMTTYVWNNAGDAATLRDAGNHALQTCSWKSVLPGYKTC